MHLRPIAQILGVLSLILAVAMAVPCGLGFWWGEAEAGKALAYGIGGALGIGLILIVIGGLRRHEHTLSHREAFLVVSAAWVAVGAVGALPFWFSGMFGGYVNSLFEAVSGFTTTGATILTEIESVPSCLLLWRAITQWIGGMGIVLLSVAILPLLGVGGMQLYKAEVPGHASDKLEPRIAETARSLWRFYLLLTVAEIIALMICGMGPFDAVCHSFATVATGGFSTRNISVESFDSTAVEGVIMFFMLAAGTNFALHLLAIRKGPKVYFRDTEFRVFLGIMFGATALATMGLVASGHYGDTLVSLRHALFQAISITTTTGFSSANFEAWEATAGMSAFVVFSLMLVGGCSGSTGGGIKVARLWLLLKEGTGELFRQIHPRAIRQVRLGKRPVPPEVLRSIAAFFVLYCFSFGVAALVLAVLGLDFESAITAAVSCIGNVGPAFGSVGPLDNYEHLPVLAKLLLTFLMILGRLELYTVLVLFVPEFWRN